MSGGRKGVVVIRTSPLQLQPTGRLCPRRYVGFVGPIWGPAARLDAWTHRRLVADGLSQPAATRRLDVPAPILFPRIPPAGTIRVCPAFNINVPAIHP